MPSREESASLANYWKQRIEAWQASKQSQNVDYCRLGEFKGYRVVADVNVVVRRLLPFA